MLMFALFFAKLCANVFVCVACGLRACARASRAVWHVIFRGKVSAKIDCVAAATKSISSNYRYITVFQLSSLEIETDLKRNGALLDRFRYENIVTVVPPHCLPNVIGVCVSVCAQCKSKLCVIKATDHTYQNQFLVHKHVNIDNPWLLGTISTVLPSPSSFLWSLEICMDKHWSHIGIISFNGI